MTKGYTTERAVDTEMPLLLKAQEERCAELTITTT